MLQVVICDDEQSMRIALREVIGRELQLKGIDFHINEFSCGETLIKALNEANYDIIFLDIEMKNIDGIETAKTIRRTNKKAVIIFVTAFPDFVFQGYEVKALNYILKPYHDKKIIAVLNTALEELDTLKPYYFSIEQKSGITKILLQDTLYFSSDKRNVIAVTKTSVITFYGKLCDLQEELPDYFIRIHNRYLVNLNYITSIDASTAVCFGNSLPYSRQYKQNLLVSFAKSMLR